MNRVKAIHYADGETDDVEGMRGEILRLIADLKKTDQSRKCAVKRAENAIQELLAAADALTAAITMPEMKAKVLVGGRGLADAVRWLAAERDAAVERADKLAAQRSAWRHLYTAASESRDESYRLLDALTTGLLRGGDEQ